MSKQDEWQPLTPPQPRKDRMMTDELKPCPFCGGVPVFELGKKTACQLHGEPMQGVYVRCKRNHCHIRPSTEEAGNIFLPNGEKNARKDAAKLWNTRAPIEVTDEVLKAIKSDIDHITDCIESWGNSKGDNQSIDLEHDNLELTLGHLKSLQAALNGGNE